MASNPTSSKDKFQPRGVPCVFIRYPANNKGYRLYNFLIDITFAYRDNRFHENIYPYHVLHSTSSQPVILPPVTQQYISYEEDEPDMDDSTQTQSPAPSSIPPRKSSRQ